MNEGMTGILALGGTYLVYLSAAVGEGGDLLLELMNQL